MQTIPIESIAIGERERQDYGDVSELAASIADVGLIEPIIITNDSPPKLIAGGRRLKALVQLQCTTLFHGSTGVVGQPGYLTRNECTEEQLKLLEYEENHRRKDYNWVEDCLSVYRIHLIKTRNAALDGSSWGMRETGRLMGVSLGKVGYAAIIARKIISGDKRIQDAQSFTEALGILQQDEIDEMNRRLAEKTGGTAALSDLFVEDSPPVPEELIDLDRERYESNPLNTMPYEEYVKTRQPLQLHQIHISRTVRLGKMEVLLKEYPDESFDHCITDPPYGIDMDMLNQQNIHHHMSNIERVEDEHDVEENLDLFADMMPAIYRVLKPNAFFVFWCDIMNWQNLYNLAIAAGFKVQRWPITWFKTHSCMNQSAQYNFTKNTEIAMVCRKGNATLVDASPTSVIACSADDARKTFAHPFAKPEELTNFITKHVTISGQLILEPFAGIGSIVIPLLSSGHRVVAIEKKPVHYYQLLENVKQHYLKLNPESVFI